VGIGDSGLGIGPNPQSPIPNPQFTTYITYIKLYLFKNKFLSNLITNSKSFKVKIIFYYKLNYYNINKYKNKNINEFRPIPSKKEIQRKEDLPKHRQQHQIKALKNCK